MSRFSTVLLVATLLTGCTPPRLTPVPVPAQWCPDPDPVRRPLVVLLPGIYDEAGDFIRHGLTRRLEGLTPPVDWVAVDLHVGYTIQGTAVERLYADIIGPARTRGYERIWLAGVSLGGFNALRTLARHDREITGVVLIAPFLGNPRVLDRIEDAGGLARWTPPPGPARNATMELWSWLKASSSEIRGRIYLAYGRDDRFRRPQAMLAGLLPPDHVLTGEGAHDWNTWSRLWDRLLDPGAPLPAAFAGKGTT